MNKNKIVKVAFLSRTLNTGGAERQIVLLANYLAKKNYSVSIFLLYNQGRLLKDLDKRIQINDLRKTNRWDIVPFLYRWTRGILKGKYDILYSMLPVQNITELSLQESP